MTAHAHEVFSDANRKAHLQPVRLQRADELELNKIADQGIDPEDEENA